ncbi:major capsid protein [uncultured Stenotrophomonas sp.]|nr:major capsid protein [uncultured Stenotrophomonas sp.]
MDFDVTAAVGIIGGISAGVALIGASKLAPAAVAVGWKWLKAAIFG